MARTILPVAVAVAVFLWLRSPATAGAAEPARFGVFDLQKVLNETRPARIAEEKEKPQRAPGVGGGDPLRSREAQEIRDKLAKINQEMERKGLSKAGREKLDAEASGLRMKLVQMRRGTTGRGQAKAPEGFAEPAGDGDRRSEVMEAATKYAQEKGFAFLFEKSYWSQGEQQKAIVSRGKPPDVTDEIIQRIKAKVQAGEQPKK